MKKFFLQFLLLSLLLSGGIQLFGQNTCLQDWRYSRPISVRNVIFGLLNDWQVRVVLNTQTLIASGKMNPDGSDIRFTTNDCCTEFPYWIQSGLNTPTTTIWARVPQLLSRDTTWIQMHYGNPNATTPVSNIDLVHFSMGNDSMGTDTATPGITVATQAYVFPFNSRTVRFRVYSDDTMRIKFKVTNDTNMVTGTSPFFNAPSTVGFHNFDAEMIASAGGHFGWYTTTGGRFMNSCTPVSPCPGSCGDAVYKPLDQLVFGALKTDTCGVLPSMKVWYRRSAFADPTTNSSWPEFDRQQPFATTAASGTVMCFNDSLPVVVNSLGAASYQWYRNGALIPGATDTALTAYLNGTYYCVADFNEACQFIHSDTITISYRTPVLDLGPDIVFCSDTGYTIQASTNFASYLWGDGSTQTWLHTNASGGFTLTVTDSFGCVDADTIGVTLHSLPQPVVNAVGATSICPGGTVELNAFNPQYYAYQWLPGNQTSGNIEVSASGSYSVIVWDQFFCSDTSAALDVLVYPNPVLELGPRADICVGDSVVIDAGSGWSNILWPNFTNNQTFTVFATGFYRAIVTDTNGCQTDDTLEVVLHQDPVVDIGPSDSVCAQSLTTLDAGTGFASYAWTNGASSQTIDAGPGAYHVIVTDAFGCMGTSNILYLIPFPSLQSVAISGGSSGLVASAAPNYQWYLESVPIQGATSSTYLPLETGTYSVGVTDPYGCQNITSTGLYVVMDITKDDIPQGFSPNGDGINDRFEIINLNQFPGNTLVVMNRWGAEVYRKEPYDNSFNGLGSNGKDLPDGTYFYILDLGNGQIFQDYLIINR